MPSQRLFTRNFSFLVFGQISSLFGNYTLKFALSMYILEKTGSASAFATILAVAMLPTILLSPLGGILADRANRRNIMVVLDVLSGLTVLFAGLALPLGHEMLVVGILLVVLSVLSAFESPTVQACIPQMLSNDNLTKGNAVVNQVQAIAALVTPFLGSLIYVAFGLAPVLWGTVVCFFLTALLECRIRIECHRPTRAVGACAVIREDFSVSLRFLRQKQPVILKLLLLAGLANLFVSGTVVVGFPYLVRTVLGLSSELYGAAESAMGVAAVLGSLFVGVVGQKLPLRRLAFAFAGLGACLLPAGFAFWASFPPFKIYLILLAAFCCCQFAGSVFSTYAISIIQARTPEKLMGKIMSLVFTLALCAQPLGQVVYGALFDRLASNPAFVLLPSGLVVCAIGALSHPFFASMERRDG